MVEHWACELETVQDFLIKLGLKPHTYAYIGNKHFSTTYQNYEQPPQRLQNLYFQSHFSASKIKGIFLPCRIFDLEINFYDYWGHPQKKLISWSKKKERKIPFWCWKMTLKVQILQRNHDDKLLFCVISFFCLELLCPHQ